MATASPPSRPTWAAISSSPPTPTKPKLVVDPPHLSTEDVAARSVSGGSAPSVGTGMEMEIVMDGDRTRAVGGDVDMVGGGKVEGEALKMDSETNDAIGGLMAMAQAGAGVPGIGNKDTFMGDEDEVIGAGGESSARGRRKSMVGSSSRGKGSRGGKGGRRQSSAQENIPLMDETASVAGSVATGNGILGTDGSRSVASVDNADMEVDEIDDDDEVAEAGSSLQVPVAGASGRGRKKNTGVGRGNGRRKNAIPPSVIGDDNLSIAGDTSTIFSNNGSVPATPTPNGSEPPAGGGGTGSKRGGGGASRRGKRKKDLEGGDDADSVAGKRGGKGGGGVTKNQPQYHVLKMDDGTMCTRADIQHDFLDYVFGDTTPAFTPPNIPNHPVTIPPGTKMTFNELYCYTLAGSSRATKTSKESLLDMEPGQLPGKNKPGTAASLKKKKEAALKEAKANGETPTNGSVGDENSQAGGDDSEEVENYEGLKAGLSRVCLLINIGRINTTFAFYPLMRTMLRSYHSIPSLQKTNATRRALQDAPRLKIMLKAINLADEVETPPPVHLSQVVELLEEGKRPSTTLANLFLALALRPDLAHEKFFGGYPENVNLLTLFTDIPIRSSERARAFLFVIWHYLESMTDYNPYSDPDRPNELPRLSLMSWEDYRALGENVDLPEELTFGEEMKLQRLQCIAELHEHKEGDAQVKPDLEVADAPPAVKESILPKAKRVRGPALNGHTGNKKRKRISDSAAVDSNGTPGDIGDRSLEQDSPLRGRGEGNDPYGNDLPIHSMQGIERGPSYQSPELIDDWAIGISTLGLDDTIVQKLIARVNVESSYWQAIPADDPDIYSPPQAAPSIRQKSIPIHREPSHNHLLPQPEQQPKSRTLSSLLN